MRVCVVGLGKIGLPLAVRCAESGHHVLGLDIDETVVGAVRAGRPPFPNEPGLDVRLAAAVRDGALEATTDAAVGVGGSDVVIVLVPLYHDGGRPDFSIIDQAVHVIGPHLRPGALVIFETTLPVGATRARFTPALEARSGLRRGDSLLVAFSPERVSSGSVFLDLARYPKLVGGIDDRSAAAASDFYRATLDFVERPDLARPNGVWVLESAEAAELAKLAETTYRDLNIGFANELALACEEHGLDVAPIIEGCNSQPYSHIHRPGLVGGHCIPVYPHLLVESLGGFAVARAARAVNASMGERAVERLERLMGASLEGVNVAVMGLSYRGGVREDAFSGAYDLVEGIRRRGGRATVHDPLYTSDELRERGLETFELGQPCEAAIVHSDHDSFRRLGEREVPAAWILDLRRVIDPNRFPRSTVTFLGCGR